MPIARQIADVVDDYFVLYTRRKTRCNDQSSAPNAVVINGLNDQSGCKGIVVINNISDLSGNGQTGPSVKDSLFFNNYVGEGLLISELMYNIGTGGDTLEFVELYNRTAANIPLGGMRFTEGITGLLPEFTLAPAKTFIMVADSGAFRRFYGVVPNYRWDIGQTLSNTGETLRLFNSLNTLVDSVTYQSVAPWALEPKGNGISLEIIDPTMNNNVATNWRGSIKPLGKKYGTKDVFCSLGTVGVRVAVDEIKAGNYPFSESNAQFIEL